MPKVAFTPVYMDVCMSRCVHAAVRRWCDLSVDLEQFVAGIPEPDQRALVLKALNSCVSRQNLTRLLKSLPDWPRPTWANNCQTSRLHVTGEIVAVGTTSFRVKSSISAGEVCLAEMESTLVCVDPETLSQSQAIPCAQQLRSALRSQERVRETKPLPASSNYTAGQLYTWRQPVRWTDCDTNGHLNNAMYASLVEEARADAATKAQTAQEKYLWELPVQAMRINYFGQPKPADLLEIESWQIPPTGCCAFNFHVKGHLVASASTDPWPSAQNSARL